MTARFYGNAESAANTILEAFQHPEQLPAALAPVFIRRRDDVPCRQWSWSNQFLAAIRGHNDARGYRQWQEVGRYVRKGEKSFAILVPITKAFERENPDTGESEKATALVGFKSAAVFGLSQTDGEPLPESDPEVSRWIESLPLLDVAKSWSLSVEAYNGRSGKPLGHYAIGHGIGLGVENAATWCHELCHAADDRLGKLKERGQHWRSETVAELGSATLLCILGHRDEADLGGTWTYIRSYATEAGIEPIVACQRVLTRTCEAVALILDTAEALKAAAPAAVC